MTAKRGTLIGRSEDDLCHKIYGHWTKNVVQVREVKSIKKLHFITELKRYNQEKMKKLMKFLIRKHPKRFKILTMKRKKNVKADSTRVPDIRIQNKKLGRPKGSNNNKNPLNGGR